MSFGPDPYLHDQHRALEEKVRAFGDRHLRAWSDDEIVASTLAQLRRLYGDAVPEPESAVVTRWQDDPF